MMSTFFSMILGNPVYDTNLFFPDATDHSLWCQPSFLLHHRQISIILALILGDSPLLY